MTSGMKRDKVVSPKGLMTMDAESALSSALVLIWIGALLLGLLPSRKQPIPERIFFSIYLPFDL